MCLKSTGITFHEYDYDIEELLERKVAIAIFVSQREHGVHKE